MEAKIIDEITYLIEAVKSKNGKPFDISVRHILFAITGLSRRGKGS